jgi:hypothetical protein
METSKSFAARALFQRASKLTRQSTEQRFSSNLTLPILRNRWLRQWSTNSDASAVNPIPRLTTYALVPQKKFDFLRAQKLLQSELNRRCGRLSKNVRYNPELTAGFVRDFAQQLRRVIRPDYLNCIRYKIILLVTIVQTLPNRQTHQSLTIVSRCLWNRDTDGSITVQTKLGYDMLAIATAFIVYTD